MMKETSKDLERVVSIRSDANTRAAIEYMTGSSSGQQKPGVNFASVHIVGRVKEDIIPV